MGSTINTFGEDVRDIIAARFVGKADNPSSHEFTYVVVSDEIVSLLQGRFGDGGVDDHSLVINETIGRSINWYP